MHPTLHIQPPPALRFISAEPGRFRPRIEGCSGLTGYFRENAQNFSAGMYGHGLADLRNYFNGQNSRARPAKNYHVLSKFPGLTAHDQPDQCEARELARDKRKGGIWADSHMAMCLCPLFVRAL